MLAIVLALAMSATADARGVRSPAPCRGSQIALTLGGQPGDFDGMSHSGTLLVLRNRGRRACLLPGLPPVTLLDAAGRVLPALRRAPPGMHPGPVVMPLTVAPGAAVSTPIRWVSGPVFANSRCLRPARVSVAIGAGRVATPLAGNVCGEAGAPARFDQPPLRPGASF